MKKLVSAKLAGDVLLVSLGLLLVFHALVLFHALPADMLWGGRADPSNLVGLEVGAILTILLFGAVIAARAGYIEAGSLSAAVNVLVWIIFAFLLLNTLGNLLSGVSAENFLFAPITLALAFFALRLAIEK